MIAIFIYVVLAVLKRNYTRLYTCLPQNYIKTVTKIKQIYQLSDGSFSNSPILEHANERIIVSMIMGIQSDVETLRFCDTMEKLVDNETSLAFVERLRNGM